MKDFNYIKFVDKLYTEASELLPGYLNDIQKAAVKKRIKDFSLVAGEQLLKEYDAQTTQTGIQIIAEWTFHKCIDLVNAEIQQQYWDAILQRVNFVIYEFYTQCLKENIELDKTLEIIEQEVKITYQDTISQLKKDLEEEKLPLWRKFLRKGFSILFFLLFFTYLIIIIISQTNLQFYVLLKLLIYVGLAVYILYANNIIKRKSNAMHLLIFLIATLANIYFMPVNTKTFTQVLISSIILSQYFVSKKYTIKL